MARNREDLDKLAAGFPSVDILQLDTPNDEAPQTVFRAVLPDILVIAASAFPPTGPLGKLKWEDFAMALG